MALRFAASKEKELAAALAVAVAPVAAIRHEVAAVAAFAAVAVVAAAFAAPVVAAFATAGELRMQQPHG